MPPVTINIPSFALDGWKTYLCAAVIVGLSVAHSFGYIPDALYDTLLAVVGGGGLAALRSSVGKSGPEPIMKEVASMVNEAIQLQPPCKDTPPNQPSAAG